MHSLGLNGEGVLRGNRADPGSPGKTVYVCVYIYITVQHVSA